jgi:hypothetical protein
VAVCVLIPVAWTPPGLDPQAWRLGMAEDMLDVLAGLAEVTAAVAVGPGEEGLARQVGWPGLRGYALPHLRAPAVCAAAVDDGYEQLVMLAPDAPDLPGLVLAKLLRPLSTRPLAVAPSTGTGGGLLGLATRLPAPDWLPDASLDELDVTRLRAAAPVPAQVAVSPGWHRLRSPADLDRLDPRLEGWDATRGLLIPGSPRPAAGS